RPMVCQSTGDPGPPLRNGSAVTANSGRTCRLSTQNDSSTVDRIRSSTTYWTTVLTIPSTSTLANTTATHWGSRRASQPAIQRISTRTPRATSTIPIRSGTALRNTLSGSYGVVLANSTEAAYSRCYPCARPNDTTRVTV